MTKLKFKKGVMYHKRKKVIAVHRHIALTNFLEFVDQFEKPIILGHNIKRFDCKVLFNQLKCYNMWSHFAAVISGFVDFLHVAKIAFPHRKSYKQSDLLKDICGIRYDAHDALEDVKALQKLLESVKDRDTVVKLIFHPRIVESAAMKDKALELSKNTFQDMVSLNVLSSSMMDKIGRTGLTYRDFCYAYNTEESDGIVKLLTMDIGGKPRVTKSKKVIQSVCEYFQSLKENM